MKIEKIYKFNGKTFLQNIILYFAMFPYVSFGLNYNDTQPFSLVFIIIYFTLFRKVFKPILLILWAFTISVAIFLIFLEFNDLDFALTIRALVSYSIFFLVWLTSYHIHKFRNPLEHYLTASWIYILYGFLQSKGFTFLDWMSANRFTGNRGVTSFAAEPTYFAMILFFLSWLSIISLQRKQSEEPNINKKIVYLTYFTLFANIMSIILLAKSSMIILWLAFLSILWFFLFASFRILFSFGLFVFIIFLIVYYNFDAVEGARPWQIYSELARLGLSEFIYNDWSINGRVAGVLFPIWGFFINSGLPGGFQTFGDISAELIIQTNYYFWAATTNHKVWSFLGTFIYELGFIGVLLLILIYLILVREFEWKRRELIILSSLLVSLVPLGVSLVPLLLGSNVIRNKINQNGVQLKDDSNRSK